MATRVAECGADAGKLTSVYTYVDGGYGTNSTTPLVKKIDQAGIPFEYVYDTRGNIISEKRGTLTTTYQYDALGQLVRVNDPHENKTWVYEYDRGGNMTRRIQYPYTTGTLGTAASTSTYAYDGTWKDQLTSRAGYPLTYDAVGNLKTYGGWVYEWEAGRQLVKQTQNEKVVAYDYDYNGMRIRQTVSNKTNGNVYATYNYTYNGSKLVHMTVYSDDLHFFYDNQGRPVKVKYNGVMYTYLHNLQGDVVGILDNAGNLVVEYKYNAWGTILSKTGSMANTLGHRNPFRYRGYVYDEETWMYWVKDRYYYPELMRFINPDTDAAIRESIGTIADRNIYAYCGNNPIHRVDTTGTFWDTIFDVVSLAASIVEVVLNPTDPWNWLGLAGDIVDLVPCVTGVGEVTRAMKGTTKIVDGTSDTIKAAKNVYHAADAASPLRKATGSYEIIFESGTNYVGKGGYKRAIKSAVTKQVKYEDKAVSISWKAARTTQDAFVDEYMRMMRRGVNNRNTYNKVWSPGRLIYKNRMYSLLK